MWKRLLLPLLVVFATPAAEASVVEGLSLSELTRRADEVVVGRVVQLETDHAPDGHHLFRRVRVDVDERWKGEGAASVVLLLRGGTLDGVSEQVIGLPELDTGERAVFFLRRVGGADRLVGMGQGAFFDDGSGTLTQRLDGLSLAVVSGSSLRILEHGGQPLVPAASLAALRAQVKRLTAGERL